MSSYMTHAVIGAVGGLALVRAMPSLSADLVGPGAAPVLGQAAIIGASAVLATLPDLDEPNSFIGRRVQLACTILGVALVFLVGLAAQLLPIVLFGAAVAGLVGGWLVGVVLLRVFRYAAGGHRYGTHSLVTAAALGIAALVLHWGGLRAWAMVPTALAWAILLHLPGDVVTRAGVPIGFPISQRRFCILPAPINHFGEPIVVLLALGVSVWLLW